MPLSPEILKRMASALGVTGDYLLDGTTESTTKANLEDRELLQLFEQTARLQNEDKKPSREPLEA